LEEYQCLDGTLNSYLKNCWDIIRSFDDFDTRHIFRAKNCRANNLVQDASGYRIKRGRFHNAENLITSVALNSQVADCSSYISGSTAVGLDRPGKESGPSDGTRDVSFVNSATNTADVADWRAPIMKYLRNPRVRINKNVRCTNFKYILVDNEVYRRTVDDVLLKCLGPNDAILAMAEVHKGICGTHQSAPKMKWLLRRSDFYWPDMIVDCFKYYKGCQVC
jgi:hypothetical protein